MVGCGTVGETGLHWPHPLRGREPEGCQTMSKFKRVTRIVAGALLSAGIFAGSVAPASAATADSGANHARISLQDTGWGG